MPTIAKVNRRSIKSNPVVNILAIDIITVLSRDLSPSLTLINLKSLITLIILSGAGLTFS